jgi:hypothetical protein
MFMMAFTGALVGALATSLLISSATGATSTPQTRGLDIAMFIPLPKTALVDGQIIFRPLTSAAKAAVRLTPRQAVNDLKSQFEMSSGSWVQSVSLGGYVNKMDIVHDWMGTKSKVPKPIPVYMVTVRGLHIASLGPGGGVHHEEVFTLNAVTGRAISSFSYR